MPLTLGLATAGGITQILIWSAAAGFLLLGAVHAMYGVAAGRRDCAGGFGADFLPQRRLRSATPRHAGGRTPDLLIARPSGFMHNVGS